MQAARRGGRPAASRGVVLVLDELAAAARGGRPAGHARAPPGPDACATPRRPAGETPRGREPPAAAEAAAGGDNHHTPKKSCRDWIPLKPLDIDETSPSRPHQAIGAVSQRQRVGVFSHPARPHGRARPCWTAQRFVDQSGSACVRSRQSRARGGPRSAGPARPGPAPGFGRLVLGHHHTCRSSAATWAGWSPATRMRRQRIACLKGIAPQRP